MSLRSFEQECLDLFNRRCKTQQKSRQTLPVEPCLRDSPYLDSPPSGFCKNPDFAVRQVGRSVGRVALVLGGPSAARIATRLKDETCERQKD